MDTYRMKLRAYLDQNPMGYTDGDSLLEELHWCYTEANTLENPELRRRFQELYYSLPELSEDKFDYVFSVVCGLSVQQEKLAFQAGVKTGFRLAAELLE
ncbi:MAG: hypothetical protein IKK11_01130 [Oscillospiraceae bacterium]|nr:hypothetical protein [Oscillospiraceae bacterium]